jgi:hypothetical protein
MRNSLGVKTAVFFLALLFLRVDPTEGASRKIHATPMLRTNLMSPSTLPMTIPPSPEFQSEVGDFEASGGTGQWFSAVSPFSSGASGMESFYLLKSLPHSANVNSPLWNLRVENYRSALEGYMNEGVPLFMGHLPPDAQVMAAALGDDYPLGAAALKASGDTSHHNAILLQPTSDRFAVAHEHQHWLDFESKTYQKDFERAIKPFAKDFSDSDTDYLWRIVWEIRGHSVQAKTVRLVREQHLPCLDRAGQILGPGDPNFATTLGYLEGQPVGDFRNAYQMPYLQITTKIRGNPAEWAKFKTMLTKFDFSDDPENQLTFAKVLPY